MLKRKPEVSADGATPMKSYPRFYPLAR